MVKFDDLFGDSQEGFKPDKKKRVGGYILGKTLGEGSFAKVRLATHVLTSEKVAVKVINKKLIVKREYVRKNMRREAVMLQRLEHPHIVHLYEVMETENSFYMVTELAEGGDFMKYLTERQYLDEAETRRYMRQIVSAVDHMHRSGVVHRDLKIENLLLDRDMNIKIIDFGLSNHWDGHNLLNTQCGSPAYAAPEIFSKKQYGPAVDVWSIGINMFAMLTGRLPFLVDPPTNLTKLHALILKGCTVPDNLTRSCQDLVARLLDPTVSRRISMKDLVTHAWLNEDYVPLQAWGLKTRLRSEDINQTAVDFMVDHLNLTELEIRDAVINCKPNSTTGTYLLLNERLLKSMPLPDDAQMTQGQRKDVVDEMKRHYEKSNVVVNGETGALVPHAFTVQHEAGQTPRFPALPSHRDGNQRRRKPITNVPLSPKKRSNSHEVLTSLQKSLNIVKLDGENRDTGNTLILQDLEHIIKDLGGDGDSSTGTTPRNGYNKESITHILGTSRKSRPPKVNGRGILKREKATSLPESLNNVEPPRTLYQQQSDMESQGSSRSVHFQGATIRRLNRQPSDVSSVVSSDRYANSGGRAAVPPAYHYNAKLQAELEALTRLEPFDSQHRANSLQSLPLARRDSAMSNDRMSLQTPTPTGHHHSAMVKQREYSSVQDVGVGDALSYAGNMRTPRQSPLDRTVERYKHKIQRSERNHHTDTETDYNDRSAGLDIRATLGIRNGLDRHGSDVSGKARTLKRRESQDSVRSRDVPVKAVGALYSMPEYTDPHMVVATRGYRREKTSPVAPAPSPNQHMPIKWRDPSRHSSLRGSKQHGAAGGTPRHQDIYNEYITQKQALSYHHPSMPPVLQSQK